LFFPQTAPLFVFQWLFDEAQMRADNVGAPVTPQQWNYIHEMGGALRSSLDNVSAVFAPSCIGHAVLSKRDWVNIKIDDISLPSALRCWEHSTRRKRQDKLKRSTEPSTAVSQLPHANNQRHQRHRQRQKQNNVAQTGGQQRRHNHLTKEEREERKRLRQEQRQRRKQRRQRQQQQQQRKKANGGQENRNRKNNSPKSNNGNEQRKQRRRQQLTPEQRQEQRKRRRKAQREQQDQQEQPGAAGVVPEDKVEPLKTRSSNNASAGTKTKKRPRVPRVPEKCGLRLLERCSWPQCNHSCPTLTNPMTGEEMRFLELLTAFGLDIEAVAAALGVDMHTLNNMERTELVNLLTQQAN